MPNYLKFTLKLPADEMNDVAEKIIHKLEELLDFNISEAKDVHEKARELKDIVIKEHEKVNNFQNISLWIHKITKLSHLLNKKSSIIHQEILIHKKKLIIAHPHLIIRLIMKNHFYKNYNT